MTDKPMTVADLKGREKHIFLLGRLLGMNELAHAIREINNNLANKIGFEMLHNDYKEDKETDDE